ncbi:unnamed protein product [Adineta steineri]|uniref:Uncharacterized protein n=2 Tax=Adineta steineri TaxID=433720 RepID=A0A815CEE8_9BILA|nr:unnamed protein product [Adineta steineri]
MAKAGYGCPLDPGLCAYHCRSNVIGSGGDFQEKRPCGGACLSIFNLVCACFYGMVSSFKNILLAKVPDVGGNNLIVYMWRIRKQRCYDLLSIIGL